jgi:hypothetical protein
MRAGQRGAGRQRTSLSLNSRTRAYVDIAVVLA